MITTFDDIRDAVLHLPKGDQMRLLSLVALEVADAHPGIDSRPNVCGGSARIIRTRIPVWLLEALRRDGRSEAGLLADYPTLTAEDLANAWNYARSHREEMDREIAANGDDTDFPALAARIHAQLQATDSLHGQLVRINRGN